MAWSSQGLRPLSARPSGPAGPSCCASSTHLDPGRLVPAAIKDLIVANYQSDLIIEQTESNSFIIKTGKMD